MLKHFFVVAGLTVVQFATGVIATGVMATGVIGAENRAAAAPVDMDKVEKEIRASADAFVAAFDKRDAAAIAAQWTNDGVYVNEEGQRFEGQQAIRKEYETLFEGSAEDLEIRIEVDSIRLINDNTVIEEGRAALLPQPPGASRVISKYTAVHVRRDGGWLIAEVRDTQVALPPATGALGDLDWLVGTWGSSKDDTSVLVNCRWLENNRFLLRTHQVTESGTATAGGLEVIGIDPSTGRITSWHFTNDGGHAVGVWTPMDGSWAVESVGVLEDGTETAATYILSRSDDDSLAWKSVNRMVGGALLPDMPEVALKRKSQP